MSVPLYLIRHSIHPVSPGLYSSKDRTVSACTMKPSMNVPFSEQPTVTLRSTPGADDVREQTVTYEYLLDVIMQAPKVIIL
jgi:hypothetical protein